MTTPEKPEKTDDIIEYDNFDNILEWTVEEEEEFLRILSEDTFKDL